MGEVFSSLMAAVGAADKVLELIRRQPKILPSSTFKPDRFSGNLALEHIEFAYPARPDSIVLSDLSFSIRPGEVCRLSNLAHASLSSDVDFVFNDDART